jgi:hypothetical protein
MSEWVGEDGNRHQATFIPDWDGDNTTGVLYPGPNAIPVESVALDYTSWSWLIGSGLEDGPVKGQAARLL